MNVPKPPPCTISWSLGTRIQVVQPVVLHHQHSILRLWKLSPQNLVTVVIILMLDLSFEIKIIVKRLRVPVYSDAMSADPMSSRKDPDDDWDCANGLSHKLGFITYHNFLRYMYIILSFSRQMRSLSFWTKKPKMSDFLQRHFVFESLLYCIRLWVKPGIFQMSKFVT